MAKLNLWVPWFYYSNRSSFSFICNKAVVCFCDRLNSKNFELRCRTDICDLLMMCFHVINDLTDTEMSQ